MTQFSNKLIQILNCGALNLAISIGYTLGIFDCLDRHDTPVEINTLANQTGLNRRYLQEWLGIMVTGGIVELEDRGTDENDRYSLPKSHGDLLCRRAGNNNLGVYTQEIPILTASALYAVQEDFSKGCGIPFSVYPQFQSFMAELSDAKHEQVLIRDFLPSVDDGKLIKRLETGICVCDLGCGQGVALNLMAEAFPASFFLGIDNHEQAVAQAVSQATTLGLTNVRFELKDAARIENDPDFSGICDWVCAFDAIHDQSHPLAALRGCRTMLKPDGLFSMIDIKAGSRITDNMDHPMAPFLYTVSLMHCMPVGLKDKGRGLGMMWGREQALKLLARAGFSHVTAREIPNDPFNLHFQCRP
ncbi:MAG: class I SAM-dependent methyltransferase [Deltaproteobacteria bacterium]